MGISEAVCACKGIRFCALCAGSERVRSLNSVDRNYAEYKTYIFNAADGRIYEASSSLTPYSPLADIRREAQRLSHDGVKEHSTTTEVTTLPGLTISEDFIVTEEEEHSLARLID